MLHPNPIFVYVTTDHDEYETSAFVAPNFEFTAKHANWLRSRSVEYVDKSIEHRIVNAGMYDLILDAFCNWLSDVIEARTSVGQILIVYDVEKCDFDSIDAIVYQVRDHLECVTDPEEDTDDREVVKAIDLRSIAWYTDTYWNDIVDKSKEDVSKVKRPSDNDAILYAKQLQIIHDKYIPKFEQR